MNKLKNTLKYLLLPITLLLFYIISFYGVFFSILLMIWIFSLSWIWIILFSTFLFGIVYSLTNQIPTIFKLIVLKFYGVSWFIVIVHTISGILGLMEIGYRFYNNGLFLDIDDNSIFIFEAMWQESPFKLMFLAIPFIGILLSLIWSIVFAPIQFKIDNSTYSD